MTKISQVSATSLPMPDGEAPAERAVSDLALALNAFFTLLRRDIVVTGHQFVAFLAQVLLQPLFFLFIFGKVLPSLGLAAPGFAALLLPGIVGLTTFTTAMQGVALTLTIGLGYSHEIDDRLLAPLPNALVALEQVVFGALRGLVAGGVIFPLAVWILGSGYSVRSDRVALLTLLLVLATLAGACMGLFIGTIVRPAQIALVYGLVFTPLLFTGCSFYPWAALGSIKWFQIVTLSNPLTYADEGIRYAMVPPVHGVTIATLDLRWVLLGLAVTLVVFYLLGTFTFLRRVVG